MVDIQMVIPGLLTGDNHITTDIIATQITEDPGSLTNRQISAGSNRETQITVVQEDGMEPGLKGPMSSTETEIVTMRQEEMFMCLVTGQMAAAAMMDREMIGRGTIGVAGMTATTVIMVTLTESVFSMKRAPSVVGILGVVAEVR